MCASCEQQILTVFPVNFRNGVDAHVALELFIFFIFILILFDIKSV